MAGAAEVARVVADVDAKVSDAALASTGEQPSQRWSLTPFGLQDWPTAQRLWAACYPGTPAAFWSRALQRLRSVPCAPAHAPLGVFLMNPNGPQGLLLLLASQRPPRAVAQPVPSGGQIDG